MTYQSLLLSFILCAYPANLLAGGTAKQQSSHRLPTPEMTYYVDVYADHYVVPRRLVEAFIEQESGWNAKAVSKAGAVGLMQLMPDTWRQYGVQDPTDISQNIGAGVHYLSDLIKQFHDLRLAVASYYCGPAYPSRRGLDYSNPDVIAYVSSIRKHYIQPSTSIQEKEIEPPVQRSTMR